MVNFRGWKAGGGQQPLPGQVGQRLLGSRSVRCEGIRGRLEGWVLYFLGLVRVLEQHLGRHLQRN